VPQQRAGACRSGFTSGPARSAGRPRGRRWTDLLWAATGRRLLRRTLLSALLGLAPALVVTPRL
jgi:hypothetical protein